jgi:hypothetical protein
MFGKKVFEKARRSDQELLLLEYNNFHQQKRLNLLKFPRLEGTAQPVIYLLVYLYAGITGCIVKNRLHLGDTISIFKEDHIPFVLDKL